MPRLCERGRFKHRSSISIRPRGNTKMTVKLTPLAKDVLDRLQRHYGLSRSDLMIRIIESYHRDDVTGANRFDLTGFCPKDGKTVEVSFWLTPRQKDNLLASCERTGWTASRFLRTFLLCCGHMLMEEPMAKK